MPVLSALSPVLVSVLTLGGVGLVFGTLIAFANKKLKVWEDPRIDAVTDLLPGTNCGACGFAGCRAFAEGLIADETQPAACTNMGPEGVEAVASYLGVEAGEANKRVARLLCAGGTNVAKQQATYLGLETCAAAATVAGGGKACAWGCLGLADCEVACDFDAIAMNPFGLPVVDPAKCTACGKCAQDAAPGLIEMRDGLAVVDYARNQDAGPEAIGRCPTGAIVWVEGAQDFAREVPARSVPA